MAQQPWRERLEVVAEEFVALAAAPDLPSVNAMSEALDLTDRMLVAIGHLNARLAEHLRLDAAQGLIVTEAAASPDHDAIAAAGVDAASVALAQRARTVQKTVRGLPAPDFDFERIDMYRIAVGDEHEDPHYRVTVSDLNQVSTDEDSRWASVAAAMVHGRRVAAETPIGQIVAVYAFEDGELLPEPIVVYTGASDHTLG